LRIGGLNLELRKAYIAGTVLLAFSYSTTAVWMLMAGIPTGMGNMLIKAAIGGLFLLVLPYTLVRMESLRGPLLPVLLLLGLYAVRLLYDVLVRDIFMIYQTPLYVLGYFFGLTLIPVIALCGAVRKLDVKLVHQTVFVFLIVANLSLLVFAATSGFGTLLEAFAGRLQAEGEMSGTAVLGPIGIGLMGACLAVFSMARLVVLGGRGIWWTVSHLAATLIGIAVMLFGASRGPALGFLISVLAIGATIVLRLFGAGKIKVPRFAWLYLLLPIAPVALLIGRDDVPIYLFDRMVAFLDDRVTGGGGSEMRDELHAAAWRDFGESPLFGSSYVLPSIENSSPHSMFYDALIAAGVLGGIALAWASWRMLVALWRAWRGEAGPYGYALSLVGICLSVIQATSGSIGQTPEFWVFMSLLILLTSPAVPDRSTVRVASAPKVPPPQAPLIGGNASAV
jgi:hypothetical protein